MRHGCIGSLWQDDCCLQRHSLDNKPEVIPAHIRAPDCCSIRLTELNVGAGFYGRSDYSFDVNRRLFAGRST
jgi:hypothetical protein